MAKKILQKSSVGELIGGSFGVSNKYYRKVLLGLIGGLVWESWLGASLILPLGCQKNTTEKFC
jgi:hypothetical protein